MTLRALARAWRPADPENARRSLTRYLQNGVVPSPEIRAEIEVALGLKAGALDEDEESERMALIRDAAENFAVAITALSSPRWRAGT